MKLVSLHPHPSVLSKEVEKYRILAGGTVDGGNLVLQFEIKSDQTSFSNIQFPKSEAAPSRRDELWKETCFEGFMTSESSSEYIEFNGSPNGNWNFYSFQDYRQEMEKILVPDPPVLSILKKNAEEISVEWRLPLGVFKKKISKVGLTVVLKTTDGTSYWALKHAGERPDFHLRSSFIYDSIWN